MFLLSLQRSDTYESSISESPTSVLAGDFGGNLHIHKMKRRASRNVQLAKNVIDPKDGEKRSPNWPCLKEHMRTIKWQSLISPVPQVCTWQKSRTAKLGDLPSLLLLPLQENFEHMRDPRPHLVQRMKSVLQALGRGRADARAPTPLLSTKIPGTSFCQRPSREEAPIQKSPLSGRPPQTPLPHARGGSPCFVRDTCPKVGWMPAARGQLQKAPPHSPARVPPPSTASQREEKSPAEQARREGIYQKQRSQKQRDGNAFHAWSLAGTWKGRAGSPRLLNGSSACCHPRSGGGGGGANASASAAYRLPSAPLTFPGRGLGERRG